MKKIKKVVIRDCFSDGATLSEINDHIEHLIKKYGSDATFHLSGYENYGDFEIRYTRLETNEEEQRREDISRKKKEAALSKKRKLFEKLAKELRVEL